VTPTEFTAAVREMAALGSVTVLDFSADEQRGPYRYACLTVSEADWRDRIVGIADLAERIGAHVTIYNHPGCTPEIRAALTRDLTHDEIAALPNSFRDVPLDDVIGEVAGG
jgi:hypothetical protein